MLNLLLTVLCTSWLLIAFRVFELFKVDQLQAILFNYFVCAITGFFFYHNYEKILLLNGLETWIIFALLTGSCFLPTFYLIAYTVKKVSVTVSTIASKTSLVIPVTVSLLFLNSTTSFNLLNGLGLVLGVGAIVMTSLPQKSSEGSKSKSLFDYFLPVLVFFGGGLVDVMVNISNSNYLPEKHSSLFPFFAFSAAATAGLGVLIFRLLYKNEKLKWKNVVAGIVLGIPNYLSIYFLIKALRDFDNNGAVIFPVVNICVILINTLVAIIFFKEKLSRANYIGLFLAIIALIMILSA